MGKHAFLIIAHNEYEVLQQLVESLDCPEADIYIYIDKKTARLPSLKTKFSRLIILKNREKVYWGTVNQIKTETALLREAYASGIHYDYYHLLSGIHYPLRPIREILSFFESSGGKSVVQPMEDTEEAKNKRLGKYHFLLKYYRSPNIRLAKAYHVAWKISLKIQQIIGVRRNTSFCGGKSSNWCSLTDEAVGKWLEDEKKIFKRFRWTYCADEYVTMSVLKEHNLPFTECTTMLYQKFVKGNPMVFSPKDYRELIESGAFYGRKFTKNSLALIELIRNGGTKN